MSYTKTHTQPATTLLTCVVQVDAAQVGEEPPQDVLVVLNGGQVVVGHDQSVQAGEHGAKLADLGPVLEAVVGDVEQTQGGAGHAGGTHVTVLVKAQEQLLQPAEQRRTYNTKHTRA